MQRFLGTILIARLIYSGRSRSARYLP